MPSIVSCDTLTKSYDAGRVGMLALDDVTLAVEPGEMVTA